MYLPDEGLYSFITAFTSSVVLNNLVLLKKLSAAQMRISPGWIQAYD